jgi:hypothetical protein
MKSKTILTSLMVSLMTAASLYAATAKTLASGQYEAAISPTVQDSQTADNIEKGLNSIQQLSSIKVDSDKSLLKFEVKDGEQVQLSQLQDAVKAVVPSAELGVPQRMAKSSSKNSTKGASGSDESKSSRSSSNSQKNTGSAGHSNAKNYSSDKY